jgi:translation initiation factor eIF-2B subunit alpha
LGCVSSDLPVLKLINLFRIKTAEALAAAGIPCSVILDAAVAYVMDKVDFVLVGSEAVVESGGLINAVGSNQIAIIAKAANKPFYALAERSVFLSKEQDQLN